MQEFAITLVKEEIHMEDNNIVERHCLEIEMKDGTIKRVEADFSKLPCSSCEWRWSICCPECEWNKSGKFNTY